MPEFSIIIPSFNCSAALKQTLRALEEQASLLENFEVIIIDDGSTDDTIAWLKQASFPFLLQFLQQANRGPGAARNRGAEVAQGDLLIFLDADMIPALDFLQAYREGYESHPNAVLVGRILAWPEAYPTLFDRVVSMEDYRDLGSDLFSLSFYHLVSCNFAIYKTEFDALGGFDESLRMTEDTDLGYRAWQQGVEMIYCPGAVGYHNHSRTFTQRCAQFYASARWTAALVHKHPQILGLLPVYQEVLPIDWRSDCPGLIMRKLGRRFLALKPVRSLMEWVVMWLERHWPKPTLLRFFYWKILASYRLAGYRVGSQSTFKEGM
ncbi:MAG: glycosyltransferase [Anaerolineales bacterium]|nr:glycosyltransferase [Anaerolineales bacterium]